MAVDELLLQTLNDLLEDDFKTFQWYLSLKVLDSCKPIPKAHLEGVSRRDTVSRMTKGYGERAAVNLTLEILKKMNFNGIAEELNRAYTEALIASPSTSSTAVAPPAGAPVTMNAQQGGLVFAPKFTNTSVNSMTITITK